MFKLGIVGAGIIGKSHSDAILKNNDCILCAVCDTVIERAEEIAKIHNAKSFTDYKEMAKEVKMDAVILNLPHFLHCEVSMFFLEKGISVLLEKPMAMNTDECDRIIDAAKKSGVKLAIGHPQRYYSAYTDVKRLISDGTYGKLCMISEVRNVNYLPNRPKWFLDKKLSGGGIVMNYGAHTLDKIMYVTGDMVKNVHAILANPISNDNIEVNAQILLETKGGISGVITYCGCPGVYNYETVFYFEKGVVKITDGALLYLSENGKFKDAVEGRTDILEQQLGEFIKLLRGEECNISTPEYSREIIRVLESVLQKK